MMLQNQLKRVAIYVRVSSEMQLDNYSLDAQENACQSFAELRGWQVLSVFREEGASAKSTDRPVFQQMIQQAESGAFDVILVHKLDRFSRKLKDMIGIIDYFDEIGVALVSATEQFDLSTPQGKMMVNVMSSVNQWYLDNLAQEISKGKRQRARAGDWNGTLSYGYTTPSRLKDDLVTVSDELRKGEIDREQFRVTVEAIENLLEQYPDAHATQAIPHYKDSSGVVLAFEQYATGQFSFNEIANLLNESGYRCESRDATGLFSKTMISELLRNRFYLGETSYGAKVRGKHRKWMSGNHDAIITDELFDKCQVIRKTFANKHKANSNARPYPLSPMLIELNTGVTWRGRFRAKKREYVRERYKDIPGTHIKAEQLEEDVINCLNSIEIPDDWHSRVMKSLINEKPDNSNNHVALNQRMERLKTLFLLGDISEETYRAERAEINQALNTKNKIVNIDGMSEIAEIMKNLHSIWEVATLEERDQLAKMLFHKIYIKQKSVIGIEPTAILWQLIQSQSLTVIRGGQVTGIHHGQIIPYNTGIIVARKILA